MRTLHDDMRNDRCVLHEEVLVRFTLRDEHMLDRKLAPRTRDPKRQRK